MCLKNISFSYSSFASNQILANEEESRKVLSIGGKIFYFINVYKCNSIMIQLNEKCVICMMVRSLDNKRILR